MKNIHYIYILPLFLMATLIGCRQKSYLEQIASEAKEFTQKQCPKQMDACTCLDSTVFHIPTLTYHYNYTVSDELDNDTLFTGETRQTLHNALLSNIKTSIELKGYKDSGLTLSYRYFSASTGELLAEFTFSKEDYTH